jgi:hypothetical protein
MWNKILLTGPLHVELQIYPLDCLYVGTSGQFDRHDLTTATSEYGHVWDTWKFTIAKGKQQKLTGIVEFLDFIHVPVIFKPIKQ